MFKSQYLNEKLGNILIYIAENAEYVGITKVNKLLYFLDFIAFRRLGKPLTGNNYIALQFGPVPVPFYSEYGSGNIYDSNEVNQCKTPEELKQFIEFENITLQNGNRFSKIITKSEFNSEYFSKRELNILREITTKYKTKSAEEMEDLSHKTIPYIKAWKDGKGIGNNIDWLDVIKDDSEFNGEKLSKEYLQECLKYIK